MSVILENTLCYQLYCFFNKSEGQWEGGGRKKWKSSLSLISSASFVTSKYGGCAFSALRVFSN